MTQKTITAITTPNAISPPITAPIIVATPVYLETIYNYKIQINSVPGLSNHRYIPLNLLGGQRYETLNTIHSDID